MPGPSQLAVTDYVTATSCRSCPALHDGTRGSLICAPAGMRLGNRQCKGTFLLGGKAPDLRLQDKAALPSIKLTLTRGKAMKQQLWECSRKW